MFNIEQLVEQNEIEKRNFIKFNCSKQVEVLLTSNELVKSEKIVFLSILFPKYSLKQLDKVYTVVNEGNDLFTACNEADKL